MTHQPIMELSAICNGHEVSRLRKNVSEGVSEVGYKTAFHRGWARTKCMGVEPLSTYIYLHTLWAQSQVSVVDTIMELSAMCLWWAWSFPPAEERERGRERSRIQNGLSPELSKDQVHSDFFRFSFFWHMYVNIYLYLQNTVEHGLCCRWWFIEWPKYIRM